MISKSVPPVVFGLAIAQLSHGAILGTNVPATPLTAERIATLPKAQRGAWTKYLKRSQQQFQADKNLFLAEMRANGIQQATNAPASRGFRGIPLSRPADWYGSDEARRIADNIVSYQTPAGGWGKQVNMTLRPRVPGVMFTSDNTSVYLSPDDNDLPQEAKWNYVGTFDNDATTTQLRYIAKVAAASPGKSGAKYRSSFLRGLEYIFAAQYPNGGWPQIWPLEGGYHDAITYNDGGMIHVLECLEDVGDAKGEFSFVSKKLRKRAAASVKLGVQCILATQIIVNGKRTVWCQQHDMLTLKPTSARNYEMPCKTSSESAGIMLFLMRLPNPSSEIVQSVHAAAEWFEKTELRDVAFRYSGRNGRLLVPAPGSGPIWSRYYDIATDQPIFGDRDKSIHDDVSEISLERRRGYSWFGNAPKAALEEYKRWSKEHPQD